MAAIPHLPNPATIGRLQDVITRLENEGKPDLVPRCRGIDKRIEIDGGSTGARWRTSYCGE